MENSYWRKCGNCKAEIKFGQAYQKCSVSSCRKYAYCSVDCWSIHDSVMGHMSAWAEEETAPRRSDEGRPRRKIVSTKPASSENPMSDSYERDILIVASKLKKYIKDRHDLNTSGNVMERLSDIVRRIVDEAVPEARKEGRKTLMDRDFKD